MTIYHDLVLVRHYNSPSLFLFEAPAFSRLKPNDQVVCDTIVGNSAGKVVQSCTFSIGSEEEEMLITACNATKPLKRIIQKAVYTDFYYPEEKDGTDQD
jgi:hypothetical protein